MTFGDPANLVELRSADYLAMKEVKRAQALLVLALGDWNGEYTFENLHAASELLRRAAWRIGTDGAA